MINLDITPSVSLVTTDAGEVTGVRLDGSVLPLSLLRRAVRDQETLVALAAALGLESAADGAALVGRVRELAFRDRERTSVADSAVFRWMRTFDETRRLGGLIRAGAASAGAPVGLAAMVESQWRRVEDAAYEQLRAAWVRAAGEPPTPATPAEGPAAPSIPRRVEEG